MSQCSMFKWIYFDFDTMSQCHNAQMDIFWFCNNVTMFKWIYFDFVTMSQCRNVQMDIYILSLSYWSSLNGEYIPRLPMRRHHNPPPSMEIDGNWWKLRKLGGVQLWMASLASSSNLWEKIIVSPNLWKNFHWKCKNWNFTWMRFFTKFD